MRYHISALLVTCAMALMPVATAFGQGYGITRGVNPAGVQPGYTPSGSYQPYQNRYAPRTNNYINSQPANIFGRQPGNLPSQYDAYQRPTVSPYLRLLEPGRRNRTLDYFTIVRPEQQFRQAQAAQAAAIQQLNQQQNAMLQQQQMQMQYRDPGQIAPANPITGAAQGLRPTGHPTTFGNTMGAFPGLP